MDSSEYLEDSSVLLQCGIRIALENEQAMMEFNLTTLELQRCRENVSNDSGFVLYLLVHFDNKKLPKTFLLTREFCCLCDEDVVSYPIPEFETTPPSQLRFRNFHLCSLADVTSIEVDSIIGYSMIIKSHSTSWRLFFRDYSERNKLIHALCEQYERCQQNPLPIHCAI